MLCHASVHSCVSIDNLIYVGGYLGLPQSTTKQSSSLLVSPPIVAPKTPLCLTFAYSTLGNKVDANGFVGVYMRKAGTTGTAPSNLRLAYNVPNGWNLEQVTLRLVSGIY